VSLSVVGSPVERPTSNKSATPDSDRLLVGISALARMLDMSTRTIRRKHSAGQIPRPLKISGSIRWRISEINRWVDAGCPDRARWEAMQRGV